MSLPGTRGAVVIDSEECKGCGLCILVCPAGCLSLAPDFNHQGYHPVAYSGDGCRADGLCFYACPEPGAITVLKEERDAEGRTAGERAAAGQGEEHERPRP